MEELIEASQGNAGLYPRKEKNRRNQEGREEGQKEITS